MATSENLKTALADESQANRTYLAFVKKADADGFPQIARLFRAAAEAETVHALPHLRAMGGVKGTAENLQAAIAGEGHEFQEMYPGFVAEAEAEGKRGAVNLFKNALAVEEIHHGLYTRALEAYGAVRDLETAHIWVCPVCGNTVVGEEPNDRCTICGAAKERFVAIR